MYISEATVSVTDKAKNMKQNKWSSKDDDDNDDDDDDIGLTRHSSAISSNGTVIKRLVGRPHNNMVADWPMNDAMASFH
jgi:hypothetical protein